MSVRTAGVARLIATGRLRPTRTSLPTRAETRERIVAHLRGLGWVPVADLLGWAVAELGLTKAQLDHDLRDLRVEGRIERRAVGEGGMVSHYQFRAVP